MNLFLQMMPLSPFVSVHVSELPTLDALGLANLKLNINNQLPGTV
jgi:hypothetical protein